jgi:hypothetical protein
MYTNVTQVNRFFLHIESGSSLSGEDRRRLFACTTGKTDQLLINT